MCTKFVDLLKCTKEIFFITIINIIIHAGIRGKKKKSQKKNNKNRHKFPNHIKHVDTHKIRVISSCLFSISLLLSSLLCRTREIANNLFACCVLCLKSQQNNNGKNIISHFISWISMSDKKKDFGKQSKSCIVYFT